MRIKKVGLMLTTLKRNWGYKIGKITQVVRDLAINEEKGPSVEAMFGVDTTPQETIDYWGE